MGVPNNIIVPFMGVEFDSSRAFSGPAEMPVQVLLYGQKIATGTGNIEELHLVSNADQVAELGGFGSDIHKLAVAHFKVNKITDTYIVMLDDALTSTAAETDLVFSGTATANGEVDLYINGNRIAVGVLDTNTAEDVAALLVTAINADASLPVTAANVTGTLTLTAKNKGVAAGDIDVRLNYNNGELLPAGITAVAAVTTPGTVDPDVSDVLDVLGDDWFNCWASSYNDATNIGLVEDFLEDRAGPMQQIDGINYFAKKDTRSNLITFATSATRNSPYSVMIAATDQPESNGEIAAKVCGASALSIQEDPAIPLHRMTLSGSLPKASGDRWTLIERNQLAQNGIATLTNTNGVQTESTVTMYLKNSAGASDIAYQFQNTVYILMRLRYRFVQRILTRYPRAKLADSAERIRSGQQVMTPAVGKSEAISWFLIEEADGQVENIAQFKKDLVVERDTTNVNRMNWLLPPDLINQFIVGSGDLQFLLQTVDA